MTYYGTTLPLEALSAGSSFLPLEIPDHHQNLESDAIERFAISQSLPECKLTPHRQDEITYTTRPTQDYTGSQSQTHDSHINYSNHFSDVLSAYEPLAHQEYSSAEVPPIDRDNKLLSFSQPIFHYTLLNHLNQQVAISLSAQLHGSFFLTVSSWATEADASPLTELTCYRRNLFQISGSITLPRSLRYILTDQGEQIPIIGQKLVVTAYESTEGTPVKIISVPFKTTSTSSMPTNDKNEKEPLPVSLDIMYAQSIDDQYVLFPLSWKRLQFRIATANNGRRKELQQQFIVRLKVVAALANGMGVTLCEADSGPIIVRGRSPRNFESRKDFPINCGYSGGRKSNAGRSRSTKAFSADSGTTSQKRKLDAQGVDGGQRKEESAKDPEKVTQFDASNMIVSPDFMDWRLPSTSTGTMTAIPQLEPEPAPPSAPDALSSPDHSRHRTGKGRPQLSAPISLSLLDEEPTKRLEPSHSSRRDQTGPQTSFIPLQALGSPGDAADLLYEYFPLGMDDWMPPVDAVYRPHVVHHTNIPPDLKALTSKSKSKRYFSENSP